MRRRLLVWLPPALLALVLTGYVLYPLGTMLVESLRGPQGWSLQVYASLLDPSQTGNVEAVWNSVLVSLLSVAVAGVLGTFFAFVFTQLEFPAKKILSMVAILPIALPPLVGVIAFLFVFGESGILPRVLQAVLGLDRPPFSLDGMSAIVVVHAYSFYVYFYLFVSTAMRGLDASLLEASANLGASGWQTFRRVILPELRPAIIGASALTFMASMASFSAPFLFAGGRRFITLQIYTTKLNGDMSLAAAEAMLLTVVSLAFFFGLNAAGGGRLSFGRTKGAPRVRTLALTNLVKRAIAALAVLLLGLEVLPILTIVLISFAREGSWTSQIFPASYTLENYGTLLTEAGVFQPVLNSLEMGVLTVAFSLVVGVSGAYLVTKGVLRRSRLAFDLLLTLSYAIPGTVLAIGFILAFNRPTLFSGFNVLVGTFWILPLAYAVREYPLVVRSTVAALENIDDSLIEAGKSFGAGAFRRFRAIILPLILPGVVSGCLLTMIAALGEFVSSILLYSYSSRPISMEILSQLRMFNFGAASAYSVVLLVIILVFVAAAGRVTARSDA